MSKCLERLFVPNNLVHLLVLCGALLVVIVPGYSESARNWAYSAIGLVVGAFRRPQS